MIPRELTPEESARLEELRQLHRAYQFVLGRRGLAKRVLTDLMTATVEEPLMLDVRHPHPEALALFREGRRSIGQHIRFMMDPANFTETAFVKNMMEENGHE